MYVNVSQLLWFVMLSFNLVFAYIFGIMVVACARSKNLVAIRHDLVVTVLYLVRNG